MLILRAGSADVLLLGLGLDLGGAVAATEVIHALQPDRDGGGTPLMGPHYGCVASMSKAGLLANVFCTKLEPDSSWMTAMPVP
jgi:hypothetical protein